MSTIPATISGATSLTASGLTDIASATAPTFSAPNALRSDDSCAVAFTGSAISPIAPSPAITASNTASLAKVAASDAALVAAGSNASIIAIAADGANSCIVSAGKASAAAATNSGANSAGTGSAISNPASAGDTPDSKRSQVPSGREASVNPKSPGLAPAAKASNVASVNSVAAKGSGIATVSNIAAKVASGISAIAPTWSPATASNIAAALAGSIRATELVSIFSIISNAKSGAMASAIAEGSIAVTIPAN